MSESSSDGEEKETLYLTRRRRYKDIQVGYNSDSSDEDTLGNIPLHWYEDYDHMGYDLDGKKIAKPAKEDALDALINDDPKTVFDKYGQRVSLSKEDLDQINRITSQKYPSGFNEHQDTIEYFTGKTMQTSLSGAHEPKRRFVPSKMEKSKIMGIARQLRKPVQEKEEEPKWYDIWKDEGEISRDHIQAPKIQLPKHSESYNPPAEYLLSKDEEREYDEMDPEDRPLNYKPEKHDSIRSIKAYNRFIQERFERCLDLYLAPRTIKQKLDIDPDSLIPKLPNPKDLEPFPKKLSIVYKGHSGKVRSISLDPTGQYLASGGDDGARVWDVTSGRCLKYWKFDTVMSVAWCPSTETSILAVSVDESIQFLSPSTATEAIEEATFELVESIRQKIDNGDGPCEWTMPSLSEKEKGHLFSITVPKPITHLVWHRKGDYISSTSPTGLSQSIQIHQISRASSQSPFKKTQGDIQCTLFHPSRPFFFVATQRSVKVYNLVQQQLVKKLTPGCRWISSMDVHPHGDNLIVGSYDKRVYWFDLDLSTKPYKTLRGHSAAVRSSNYHKRHPLFATTSDDGHILIYHGMVYNDFMQNPLIVPVKKLGGHQTVGGLGVLASTWHHKQPWLFTSGADGKIHLYV